MQKLLMICLPFVLIIFFACSSHSQDTDIETDISADISEAIPDNDVYGPRTLAQKRLLGDGGFFGISAYSGHSHLAIGAHYAEIESENPSGKVYIYKKGKIPLSLSEAVVLTHPEKRPGAGFGYTVGGLCDINGDGKQEMTVAAHLDSVGSTPNCGTIVVFYGSDAGWVENAVLQLPENIRKQSDIIGQSLVCYDTDGDGYDDVVAGGQNAGTHDTGMLVLWKGSEKGISADPALTLEAVHQVNKQYLGASLAVGDVDGDGTKDLIAGGWGLIQNADSLHSGGVYVYKGGSDWSMGPSYTIFPEESGEIGFGSKVAVFTTAGITYLAVLATQYHQSGGVMVYRYENNMFVTDRILIPSEFSTQADALSDFDFVPDYFSKNKSALVIGLKYYGTDAAGALLAYPFPEDGGTPEFLMHTEKTEGDKLGTLVKNLGDINGDGLADFLSGIPEHLEGTPENGKQTGGIVLFY